MGVDGLQKMWQWQGHALGNLLFGCDEIEIITSDIFDGAGSQSCHGW